jgi:hypothetical protein
MGGCHEAAVLVKAVFRGCWTRDIDRKRVMCVDGGVVVAEVRAGMT